MFEYENYIIVTEPDYQKMIRNRKDCDEYYCIVYEKNDSELKNCLYEFNMMSGFEFDNHTRKSIEAGIKKIIDASYSTIQLELCEKELIHQKNLLYRSIRYISKLQQDEELYKTLYNEIGLTEEEIAELDFDSFSEYQKEEGMNLNQ